MGTTAQKLQAILDSKADIAAALEEKHAVVPETLAEYGDAIRTISQNDAPNIRNPVKFVDYDGTLLHSYGVQAALALEELPELPTRPGLTNQGWNYTLEQLKTQVNTIGKAIVGCNYITSDGKTRFHITIRDPKFKNFRLGLAQTKSNSYTIDWGDGSASEGPFGTTTYAVRTHDYTPTSYPASYVITLTPVGTGKIYFSGAIVSSATQTGAPSQNTTATQTTAQGSMFDKIEIGDIGPTLGNHAFHWITSVKTINIPKCVTSAGQQAFGGWDAAKGIVIPNSITSLGVSAFAYCYATEMISLPPTITSIPTTCFRNCYALMELVIPYTVTSIGSQAFLNCGAMQDLKFPSTITSIGASMFEGCFAIPTIEFLGNATITGDKIFYNCNSLKIVNCPSNFTVIGSQCFASCQSLQRLTFEGNITSVAAKAFNSDVGLRTIDFSHNTTIPTLANVDAFQNTPTDRQIIVPDALYDDWILADNWKSTTYSIVSSIVKASEA